MRRLVLAVALLSSGCGYRFTVADPPLPAGLQRAWAPVFVNRTLEPGVEATFTQAFRARMHEAGALGGEGEEAQVEGEVLALSGGGTVLSPTFQLASYRLSGTLRLRLKRGGRTLAEVTVTGTEDYLPDRQGADVLLTEQARGAALARLAESMSRDGYARLATAPAR